MKNTTNVFGQTAPRKERNVEEWQVFPQYGTVRSQTRRELLARVVPVYQAASLAEKTLILNDMVKKTGYTRKSAIRLLNHPPENAQVIRRPRLPLYGLEVQQALFLSWKAAHSVCAKRLVPFLPTLVESLERCHHLHLAEEERRQVLTMSVSTAERFLQTQHHSPPQSMSLTTPGPLRKSQIPVRTFAQWEESRPGFVEMDLVAHCGTHADGSFLYTLTLTDIATGWTECLPLLYKSADAVLAALAQARVLFPFPLLGVDTDDGCEFINESLIAYCAREHLTFTRGRVGVKPDQAHVEQKNGAVVRAAVGHVRLEGVRAYHQLREVYRALRLMVNGFQPSLKLQSKVREGDRVRRVYDVAQTPLQRVLTSGILSAVRQEDLRARVQQVDPLALSEHLDALRHALWCDAHLPAALAATRPRLPFCLASCVSGPPSIPQEVLEKTACREEHLNSDEILNWPRTTHDPFAGVWEEILEVVQAHPEWTSTQILQEIKSRTPGRVFPVPLRGLTLGLNKIRSQLRANWEEPWPTEFIQGGKPKPLPTPPQTGDEPELAPSQPPAPASLVAEPVSPSHQCLGSLASPSTTAEVSVTSTQTTPPSQASAEEQQNAKPLCRMTIEQAIATYLRDVRALGRKPKTVAWHQSSLVALQQYVWQQFQFTEVHQLSRTALHTWLADLSTAPSAQTGARLAVNSIAAYARSARAFCNWLMRQAYVAESPFPKNAVPKAPRSLPQLVDPELFARLLQACHLPDEHAGQDPGMTARNHAILWLLLDTGLSVSEVCGLRLADVDGAEGIVRVSQKGREARILPLSVEGQHAVCTYLDRARLTSAWKPAVREAQEAFLLTELRCPLTKNCLTLLFLRLNQRAGFTTKPISPSMLRDTYAVRFLQAGGDVQVLQEQLGLADRASVRRYQRFCDEQSREAYPEKVMLAQPARQSKSTRGKALGQERGRRRAEKRKERS